MSPELLASLACGAAALAVAMLWASRAVRPRNSAVVDPGKVIRSGRLTPFTLRVLAARHAVRTIVDLGSTPPGSRHEARTQRAAAALGLRRVSLRGLYGTGAGNPNAYLAALRVMTDPQAQPVLVLCAAGADRTGACVALYRHLAQGVALEEALQESRRFGHDPSRNSAMHAFVRQHTPALGRALAEGQPLSDHPPADMRLDPATPHHWSTPPNAADIDRRESSP